MAEHFALTRTTDCSGCAAKLSPALLAELLGNIKQERDPNLLVGFDTADDAAVYKLTDDLALVSTLDFFPPVVDDPYAFGAIAATNALSDIYAMGATPKVALNIMAVPEDMPKEAVQEILRGGYTKVQEAGATVCGGHSIYDDVPKYGLAVQGIVHPDRLLQNSKAKLGDVLILTKPLGVGPVVTAEKVQMAKAGAITGALESMQTLNRYALETAKSVLAENFSAVHALTDVTGFGLMGHIVELMEGAAEQSSKKLRAKLTMPSIPLLDGAMEAAKIGFLPAGMYRNRRHAEAKVHFADEIQTWQQDVLFCPETSGGLLFAVDAAYAERLLFALHEDERTRYAAIIGQILEAEEGNKEQIEVVGA